MAGIVLALGALAWVIATQPGAYLQQLLFFSVLVAIVSFFSIELDSTTLGFEAGVIFPAILLLHDPVVALVATFVGTSIYHFRTLRLRALYEPAVLAASYFIVAVLYASAVDRNAGWIAKASGYVLLVVGFLAARIGVLATSESPKRLILLQTQVLIAITPIVAIEITSFLAYGRIGFVIAFGALLLVALAMRNVSQLEERNLELGLRNRELSILTEGATGILTVETEGETIRQMVALIGKLARLKAAAVVTWESKPVRGSTVYRFGECLSSDQDLLRWIDAAGFRHSAPTRPFVFQGGLRRFPLSAGAAIQVLIGLQTAEVIYGIMIYETEDPAILQIGSLNLLALIVNQIAISLQDQSLRLDMAANQAQLESQAVTMATLLDLSTSLIGSTDVEVSLTRVAKAIREALGFEGVVFGLYDRSREVFMRRAQAGLDQDWEKLHATPVPADEIMAFLNPLYRVSNSYFVPNYGPEPWRGKDIALVPLNSGGQMIGYLSAIDPGHGHTTLQQVQTLEIFAVQAVMAVESARHYEEIRRLTFIDGLTPAYNYRYFQESLEKELHRHHRTGRPLALGMLDIDNFKLINDTFGHPVGDEILKGLVEELMKNARDTDVVARYGGEEFALILPDTPAAAAREACNRMRELIARREFPMRRLGRTLRVTASIGIAIYPSDGTTSTDLIARADAALYFAKKSGKNQVAMANELPDAGVQRIS